MQFKFTFKISANLTIVYKKWEKEICKMEQKQTNKIKDEKKSQKAEQMETRNRRTH